MNIPAMTDESCRFKSQSMKDEDPPKYETGTPVSTSETESQRKGAQCENGFFKIAFELGEAFAKINLSPRESRVLWVIFRKTYGWDKTKDRISGSQLAKATEMQATHCSSALNSLIRRNIVFREGGKFTEIGINTRYWEWKEAKKASGKNLPFNGKFDGELTVERYEELTVQRYTQQITTDIPLAKAKGLSASADDASKPESKKPKTSKRKKPSLPNCPHEKILEAWERHFPAKTQPTVWRGENEVHLRTRWREGFTQVIRRGKRKGQVFYTDLASGIDWWNRFFEHCAKFPMMKGSNWFQLEWVIRPRNFDKTIDGKYEQEWDQ